MAAALAVADPAVAAEPMSAPATQDDEVGRHVTLGQRHLERGRYQDAIAEFRRAYELRADPRFLYDIAEAYRQLGIVDRALFFYERYRAALSNAPDRASVEATVEDTVEDKIAELRPVRGRAGGGPAASAPGPVPSLDHDVVIVPVTARDTPLAEAPAHPPRHRSVWRRWWVWTALGVVIAAGITAAALMGSDGGPSAPTTALGDKRFF
jgi:tetratricopeptide (TPR) repeat protein